MVDESSDDKRSASPESTPTAVELFLELGSARDFAVGCRELIDLADEHLARLDSQSPVEIAGRVTQALGVPPQLSEQIHRIFAEMERDVGSALASAQAQEVNLAEWTVDPFAVLGQLVNPDPLVARFVSRVQTELAAIPGFASVFLAYADAVQRRPRQPLMLRALLGAVCSRLEVSVARALRRDLLTQGEYAGLNDASLEDALQRLMRGGLSKWRSTLQNRFNLDVAAASADWSNVEELFERRHVLIHRDPLVDHRYRAKVSGAPALSTPLTVNSDYLRQAVDLCETVTVGLIMALLGRAIPASTGDMSSLACRWGDQAVDQQRLVCAEGYHRLSGTLAADPVDTQRCRVEC
ncbi:MAG: hypothetical protein ACRDR6_02815 [Pseudonocardiaceae bacterium]